MTKKIVTLALSLAVAAGIVSGSAFADNSQLQTSFGPLSPNTSSASNNDTSSHNQTDVANDKSVASHNDFSKKDSFNKKIEIEDSFNDYSTYSKDSHDNNSVNQAATGQVNLNDSYAGDINAADNASTIFDGDVKISGNECCYGYGESYGYGYGYGGGDTNNINTGIMTDSIQGDRSAQFTNVGVGLNESDISKSNVGNSQTSNLNVLGGL